ncbi:MAG: AIPR family protein [Succiniclasticum sp.]|uniref:AIPR family protein n=1 Tax=Succiniclasticum sp. TaxID=2775030 RepID=UPI002A915BF0|nr:AIPR family protein [Succiniclasticum sp.]MDY6290049.1 AIPR family protein [Succiniclasticum sp.]
MATNLKLIRIENRLDELFNNKIDLSNITNENERNNKYYSCSIAALILVKRCGISYETASQAITDGYHDIGIDAVYSDTTQKKLFLVQSKWRSNGSGGISQEEATTFVNGVKRIINLDLEGCNEKLTSKKSEITEAIQDMEFQIEMIFCHTGNQSISDYNLRPITELLENVNGDDPTDTLILFSEEKLQDIYDFLANSQNFDNITLNNVILNNWGFVNTPFKAYYGTIPVSVVGEWYGKYGNRLFAKNIRYYKGSTMVNQGIKEVLKNEPQNFYYYNNGIKILCKNITKNIAYSTTRDMGVFTLEGVTLVNGAQTTGVIGSVFAENQDVISDAKVFIQMIDLGDTSEEQIAQITKLSNTQNRIDGKDFASLDPNQERLRKELSLGGIQYLYKTGAKIEDPEHQISLDETIISQACLLSDLSLIALVKRNIGALTENIDKPPYKLLFNNSTNSFSLYNGVQVLRIVENCILRNVTNSTGRKRLVLVHGNRFLLYLILCRIKQQEEFNTCYIPKEKLTQLISPSFGDYWEKVYNAMEKRFPDSYPAHIFKNVGRLKEILILSVEE